MAKRQIKNIVVPIHLWEHPDLTIQEKHILIDIDSLCNSTEGVSVGTQMLANLSGLNQKEVKSTLNELYLKGALELYINEDGTKTIKPLLYKERYIKQGDKVVIGDSPKDMEQYDWEEIQAKWSEYCPTLPPVKRFSPLRKRKLRAALKSAELTVSDLYKCFQIIGCTPFLNGGVSFSAHFDWVISKAQNLQKIYEGFYAHTVQEKKDYEDIMNDRKISQQSEEESFYR